MGWDFTVLRVSAPSRNGHALLPRFSPCNTSRGFMSAINLVPRRNRTADNKTDFLSGMSATKKSVLTLVLTSERGGDEPYPKQLVVMPITEVVDRSGHSGETR